jgi:hypothetical protein
LKSKLAAQAGKSKLAGKLKLSKKFDENPFNDDEPDPEHDQLLSDIASELLRNLEIKDHTNGMTTYHACFVGTEAVDFMVNSELASSREEAVKVGNEMQKAGYFEHVAGADNFKDDVTFYHFKGPTISNEFVEAIDEMELGNHSNATDILTAVRDGGSLMNADFREEWYSCTAHKKRKKKKKMELSWCNHDACYEAIREKVVGDRNSVELTGPATGQVVYSWEVEENEDEEEHDTTTMIPNPPAVLMLVKRDEDELLKVAAKTIEQLMEMGVQVLVARC